MSEALTRIEAAAIAETGPKTGQDAVRIYINSLLSPKSRYTMIQALARITDIVQDREPADSHAENTRRVYEWDWSSIRRHHVEIIKAKLQDKFNPRTVNKILAALRGVLIQCRYLRLMTPDDLRDIIDLKKAEVQKDAPLKGRAVSSDEIYKLALCCRADKGPAGVRDAALLSLAYGAALRRFEIAALSFEDWKAEDASIHVRCGKRRKERMVYLGESVARVLARWLNLRGQCDPSAPLFVPINKSGKIGTRRLTDQSIYDIFLKRALSAGIQKFSPHDMRRSAISDLLDKGVDISTVAKVAGHSSVQVTQQYDRRNETAKKNAAELLKVPFDA